MAGGIRPRSGGRSSSPGRLLAHKRLGRALGSGAAGTVGAQHPSRTRESDRPTIAETVARDGWSPPQDGVRDGWSPPHLFAVPLCLKADAAGYYKGATMECMSDYAISSYTPTIAALLKATRQAPRQPLRAEERSVVIVAEANAPGHRPLPNTLEETALLRGLLPSSTIVDTSHEKTGMRSVLNALPTASVLHVASHGKQDPKAPLDSGFVLRDGVLTLSMLMEARTQNANFAFLSACESAMGDNKVPDEAIHLAAAMMFIGFRSVVATLWSMHDADGPKVAARVYRELLDSKRETFDYDAIPRALDAVVRELREDGVHPSRWATWIHMGI